MQNLTESAQKQPRLLNSGLAKVLEVLLNQLLKRDEDQGAAFAPCDEKVIQLSLSDIGQTFFIVYQINDEQADFTVQTHLMGQADAHIRIALSDLMAKKSAERIVGDVVLGQTFLDALYSIEIDWEEQLSHVTGDLVAFKVGHAVRSGLKTQQAAKQKIGDTLKEYLQFEINLLPTKHQVSAFKQQVQTTATAVDAIEARINALLNPFQK